MGRLPGIRTTHPSRASVVLNPAGVRAVLISGSGRSTALSMSIVISFTGLVVGCVEGMAGFSPPRVVAVKGNKASDRRIAAVDAARLMMDSLRPVGREFGYGLGRCRALAVSHFESS